ncbi:hypothetical protein PR202_ga03525 [Eleusine coracana subsp. coracana]|uniref:Ribulose bisphosphate carboxylase small subunit n=1 Tax=Eleusine coracana subsp. coracana TaxID=191504 RepID=A0AAV5BPM1_ELECO|nr:hypothetical protein PR202_ga03525 [Eleusine coracana subsp. coracana]
MSATSVAPFQGLKSTVGRPISRHSSRAGFSSVSNGGRIRCMQVWPIEGNKKFETLSYLPPLSTEDLLKQIEYLIRSKWIPCLEFSTVLKELEEVKAAYPNCFIRVIGFDNVRQVQCISFIAYKPDGN